MQETLDRLGLYWKRDPGFVPVKDKATVRLNVSIGGGGVELLATGPKWYDTRKEQGRRRHLANTIKATAV